MTTRARGSRSFYCREWVFEKIQTCLQRRKEQEDLKTKGAFIVGGPGSGKTTLLKELIFPSTKGGSQNDLSKKVLAYHFCEAHNYSSVSVSEFVRSLAEQLSKAEALNSYREKFNDPQIQDALKLEQCAKNPDVSFKEGILLPLNSITPPEDVFVVVVDSIDESFLHSFDSGVFSGSRTIAELVATHHDLLPSWLFLVISARKQSKTVTKMFTGFRKLTLDDLRKAHVVRDIQGYILNRLDDDKELRKYLTRETAEIFNQLHIKSNGCFLYLEKVLDGIEDQLFSLDDVQDIPGTLNGLFLWLCNRLYTAEQFSQMRLILNVILASQNPLRGNELYQAVWTRNSSISTEEFQKILELMNYLIVNVEDSKCIFHHSFAEWLIDVKHCTPKYLCSPSDGHAMLALRCTLLASNKQSVDLHQFAVHLSRASFKEELSQEHFALWLLWSGAPLSETLAATDLPRQKALQILLDAGADVSNLDQSGELTISFGKETEESIKAFLEKGTSVDRVDSVGRTQLCNAAFNGNADVVKILLQHGANVNFSDPAGESPLMLAAKQGHADVVFLLVNCGANANQVSNDGCTALRTSASGGHSDVVSILLKHGAIVDLADNDKRTALRGAAWGGHTDVVQQLFQHGANLNLTDKDGRSALIAAAYMGHKAVVRYLLEHHADVNLADKDGRTALSVAVLCISASPEHTEVVRLLLEHKADVDRPDFDGMTSLCVACLEGHYNVVKLLLNASADISHWDRNGRTPLFAASASGHVGIVKILLEKNHKAQPASSGEWRAPKDAMFRADNGGWTPLMIASFQGHSSVVKALLEAGVHMNDRDREGKTCLIIAAQEGHCEVISALLRFGAPVNQATKDGRTALYYSAMEGHFDCLDVLVKNGANINGVDSLGRTPLFSVTIEGNEEMVDHLLKHGAVVDCIDNDGRTPLQGAAWQGSYNLVALLLNSNADVNLSDNFGRTALMSAAWQGQNSVIQLMIDKGAEVDKVSSEGATALSIACQEGHDEVAQILLENGANMNHTDTFGRTPMQVASEAGHTKIMKALEAYSVVRMNDTSFTSALKRKVSTASESLEAACSAVCEVITRKESISSSGSSTQGSRHDISSHGDEEGASGSQSLPTPTFSQDRRYSSSFLEVHKVAAAKETWNAKCPPYTSQETVHREPPPYSEQPMHSSLKVNDDIAPVKPDSPKARRKPFSMLHKVKIKRPFAIGGSGDRKAKSKSPHEKRKLFSSRKSSNSNVKSTEVTEESASTSGLTYRLSDSHNSVETSV